MPRKKTMLTEAIEGLRQHIPCDGENCPISALYKVEYGGAWYCYCLTHYVEHFTILAKRSQSEARNELS